MVVTARNCCEPDEIQTENGGPLRIEVEATPGFEPGIRALQAPALATWPRRLIRRPPRFRRKHREPATTADRSVSHGSLAVKNGQSRFLKRVLRRDPRRDRGSGESPGGSGSAWSSCPKENARGSHAPGSRWSDDPQLQRSARKSPAGGLGVCERIFGAGDGI